MGISCPPQGRPACGEEEVWKEFIGWKEPGSLPDKLLFLHGLDVSDKLSLG